MVRNSEHLFDRTNLTPLAIVVLLHLARSPNNQYYVREIAASIQGSVGGTYKVLKDLEKMALIKSLRSGRNLYFRVNSSNSAIKYFKIFMNIQEVQINIQHVRTECMKIILFGSCSIGEDTKDSDIDLLIVTENADKVRENCPKFINSRPLKAIIVTPKKLLKMKNKDPGFFNEINNGIIIWREQNE